MADPRTPVLVGVGQISDHRPPEETPAPADLWAEAARRAEADAGAALLGRLDTIASVQMGTVRYPDPGRALARRLGVDAHRTLLATIGGNTPQLLVNELAAAIARGEADTVLVGGAECLDAKARRHDLGAPPWPVDDDPPCPERVGKESLGTSAYETAHGLVAPINIYPLFETALRHRAGRTVDEHQRHVSELWATFARVAADNPHAWSHDAPDAETIRTPGPDNRIVSFPYLKLMCARVRVDQAAALLLTSTETADAAGVPDDRRIYLHAGADAHDHWFVTERDSLARSPAIAEAGRAALGAAGLGIDDIARFDLYSCFPSAVEIALDALGLRGPLCGDPRPLTVTGGLAFAGGPLNDYVSHSIASMADALRADPGSYGMTTGLGWYVTKHSAGIWSTTPPARGYVRVDPAQTQAAVDARPRREPAGARAGPITIEATTVPVGRDGTPERAIVLGLTADGRRVVATSPDPDVAASMMAEPWEGRTAEVTTDGTTNTLRA